MATVDNSLYLKAYDVNLNASLLWKSRPVYAEWEHSTRLNPMSPERFPWLGRLVFWIQDWLSGGRETKNLHKVVLQTLQEMEELMKSEESHWHFTAKYPNSNDPLYGGNWDNRTYYELAEKLLKSSFAKTPEIKAALEQVKTVFDAIDFEKLYGPLTKDEVIKFRRSNLLFHDGLESFNKVYGPSLAPREAEMLIEHLKDLKGS